MNYNLKQYQKISIKVLLTIVYILILSLVIIYFRFPYKKYFDNFISRLETTTYTKISLKDIDYRFPNKIDIQDIIIKKEINEHNLQLIKADKFIGKIKFLPLLTANLGFNYQANLYNGEIDGSIYIKNLGEKNETEISAQMKDLDISQYDLLSQLLKIKTSGKLNGNLELNLKGGNINQGNGNLLFNMHDGKIYGLNLAQFPLPVIAFEEMDGIINLENGNLLIDKIEMKGKDFNLDIKGSCQLKETLNQSTLDLLMHIKFPIILENMIGNINPKLRNKRGSDGYFSIPIKGTFNKPYIDL